MDPTSPAVRTFTGPVVEAIVANTPGWRAADIGAANGHGNARSVARMLSAVTLGGQVEEEQLLSSEAISLIFEQQSDGVDLVVGIPLRFGIGFGLPHSETIPYIPQGRVCFWVGGADRRSYGSRSAIDRLVHDEQDGTRHHWLAAHRVVLARRLRRARGYPTAADRGDGALARP